jgi:hypothetical protein
VVSILATGTRVRGFKPGRSFGIFGHPKKNPQYAFLRKGSKICPMYQLCGMLKNPSVFRELRLWWQNWGEGIVSAFAGRGLAHLHDAWRLWGWMRELLARGKNTIDPEVIDPGSRSVEIAPWKVTLPLPLSSNVIFAFIKSRHYTSSFRLDPSLLS